jgi:hypothetical protein
VCWRLLLLTGAVLLANASRAGGPPKALGALTVENFKLAGHDYLVAGRSALIRGRQIEITDMSARFYNNKRELTVSTAYCAFDREQRRGHSDAPVRIVADGVAIDGVGMDLDMEKGRVRLRRDVRVRITHIGSASLARPGN